MATLHDVEQFVHKNLDICDAGRPASPEVIEKAEQFLGLRFPEDYRDFLKRWGTLAIGTLEFYGITGDSFGSSSVPDAIWLTNVKRQQVGLPSQFVIIYDNNGVEYYCLDTTEGEGSRIVAWDVRSSGIRTVKAASLFDLILDEAADSV